MFGMLLSTSFIDDHEGELTGPRMAWVHKSSHKDDYWASTTKPTVLEFDQDSGWFVTTHDSTKCLGITTDFSLTRADRTTTLNYGSPTFRQQVCHRSFFGIVCMQTNVEMGYPDCDDEVTDDERS